MIAMISQPMKGYTEEEIVATREKAKNYLESHGYEFVNTKFTEDYYSPEYIKKYKIINIPLWFLTRSLTNMCKCDTAYFCHGWDKARGCIIEHKIAESYGLNIIYEDNLNF